MEGPRERKNGSWVWPYPLGARTPPKGDSVFYPQSFGSLRLPLPTTVTATDISTLGFPGDWSVREQREKGERKTKDFFQSEF